MGSGAKPSFFYMAFKAVRQKVVFSGVDKKRIVFLGDRQCL